MRGAEEAIEREIQEFNKRRGQRLSDLGADPITASPGDTADDPAAAAAAVEHSASAAQQVGPTNRAPPAPTKHVDHDKDHDENGDVMVEAEEDTVIY